METIDGIRTALLSLEVDRLHLAYTWLVVYYYRETVRLLLWSLEGNATELLGKSRVGRDKYLIITMV